MTWDIYSYWIGYGTAIATIAFCYWIDKRQKGKKERDFQKELKKETEYWEQKYREEKK